MNIIVVIGGIVFTFYLWKFNVGIVIFYLLFIPDTYEFLHYNIKKRIGEDVKT